MVRGRFFLSFVGPKNGRLKADVIRSVFIKKVLTPLKDKFGTLSGEIGFAHARLHSFRHYFISQAFLGGASEGEIRSWVGHRDSRVIERYRHLRDKDARRKMEGIKFFEHRSDEDKDNPKMEIGAAVAKNESKFYLAETAQDVPDRPQRNTQSEAPAVGQQQQE